MDFPSPLAWGALWVHVGVLVVEWRLVGLPGAGRRAVVGLLVAGVGVLLLGVGLGAWMGIELPEGAVCQDGILAVDPNSLVVRSTSALGLALVPLAGIALRLVRLEEMPIAGAAVSVAVAAWLQPVLPVLAWLPTSLGAGVPLALLLVAALVVLSVAMRRGSVVAIGGLALYFVLSAGGGIVLGIV